MGRSIDPGRRNYSALNLWIDFGTEAFFILISEPFGLQVEKRWSKCLRRTRSPRWTNLARSVRGESDQVMEPVFEPRIYSEKVNPLPSSCSRTSELGGVQTSKSCQWDPDPSVGVGACPHPDRHLTAAAHTTAREIATLAFFTWRELSHS
jgi:hypothetical protein